MNFSAPTYKEHQKEHLKPKAFLKKIIFLYMKIIFYPLNSTRVVPKFRGQAAFLNYLMSLTNEALTTSKMNNFQ